MKQSKQFIKSLSRGLQLLSIVCESKSALSVSEQAAKCNLGRSTIQRLSYTLNCLGLIDRERDTKRFHIGPKMISLALAVEQNLELGKVARPYLQEASDDIGETVVLAVLSGAEIVIEAIVQANQPLAINIKQGVLPPPPPRNSGRKVNFGFSR